jgi:hypothetical protein
MDYIDPAAITLKVINGIYSGVTTVELDNLAAETAATMTAKHPGEENFQKIDICFYGINKKTQTGNLVSILGQACISQLKYLFTELLMTIILVDRLCHKVASLS